jgi:hypothetical protein
MWGISEWTRREVREDEDEDEDEHGNEHED